MAASTSAQAADANRFDPEYMYADHELFDYRSMNTAEIQGFMDDLFAQADGTSYRTKGVEEVEVGEKDQPKRKETKVIPRLKEYQIESNEVTRQPLERLPFCRQIPAVAGMSSAQYLHTVAEACGVNPKFLLVLLQKEQGLLTANGKGLTLRRYRFAAGYGCPDSTGCQDKFEGFHNQVHRAASRVHQYLDPAFSATKRRPFEMAKVAYAPKPDCETPSLLMKTNATVSLYNYTPYQPNPAVLANLGTPLEKPDKWYECRAYGNSNFWRYYSDWFNDPSPGSSANRQESFVRIGGANRIETAVALARRQFPNGAAIVYVARQDVLVDALSAGAVKDGPILLVPSKGEAPKAVLDEINRLGASRVVAVGGQGAVSEQMLDQLSQGRRKLRLGGANRFEVAANVALHVYGDLPARVVYLADGLGPGGGGSPDALSGGMSDQGPVVFVSPGNYAAAKRAVAALKPDRVVALGGAAVVSEQALKEVAGGRATARLAGANRFETAIEIARDTFPNGPRSVIFASGRVYADAVAAGTLTNTAVILMPENAAGMQSLKRLPINGPTVVAVAGGDGVIDDARAKAAAKLLYRERPKAE